MCGRWLTAANAASWFSGRHAQHLRSRSPPTRRSPSAPARATSSRAASGSPAGRGRASRRRARCPRLPCRRSDAPARTSRCGPCSTRRAASTTSRFVEPTSITSMPGSTRWRIALNVASVADDRHGDQHDVGARDGEQRRLGGHVDRRRAAWPARSSMATCCSRSTRLTRPARFSASANEPPIRPQPITPSCSNISAASLSGNRPGRCRAA